VRFICPPLIVTREEVDRALQSVDRALTAAIILIFSFPLSAECVYNKGLYDCIQNSGTLPSRKCQLTGKGKTSMAVSPLYRHTKLQEVNLQSSESGGQKAKRWIEAKESFLRRQSEDARIRA
jgi:hypothetical protein